MKYIHPLSLEILVVRNVRKDLGLAWPSAGKRRSSAPRAMLTKATKNLLRRSPTSTASTVHEKFVKIISSLHSKIHKISNIRYIHQEKSTRKKPAKSIRSEYGLDSLESSHRVISEKTKIESFVMQCLSACWKCAAMPSTAALAKSPIQPRASSCNIIVTSEAKFHTDASCQFVFIESPQSLHCEGEK